MQIQINTDHNIEGHEALAAQVSGVVEMEARLEGRRPIAVTHQAATLDQAVDGAADKLAKLIESTLGRLHHQESRRTDPPLSGSELTEQS
jgi:ribosome-associated translation inhibitor RaiA